MIDVKRYISGMKVSFEKWKIIYAEYKGCQFHPYYLDQLLTGKFTLLNPALVAPYHLGNKNKHRTIALIVLDLKWVQTAGFFALFHRTLCALYFSDKMGFVPVVANWDMCAYEEDHAIFGTKNVFEYYFKQPASCSVEDALYSNTVIIPSNNNMDLILFEYQSAWYELSDKYISKMGEIYRKYIHFNDRINNEIEKDIEETIGNKKTLGIHFRGADFRLNANGHPVSLTINDYFPYINKALKQNNYEQIFVATDDTKALTNLKKRYNNITFFSDVLRTTGDVSVAFLENNRKNHKYRLGYEVLRDAFALASCDGLIAGHSQVAVGARIMKASDKKEFKYLKIIEKGINHNSNDWVNIYETTIKKRKKTM